MGALICVSLCACKEQEEPKDDPSSQKEIRLLEDSIRTLSAADQVDLNALRETQRKLTKSLLAYYEAYPESMKSATYLDKASMTFADMGDYYKSAQWADTLLNRFPNYAQRALVLESQATAYDALIQPRDSARVRFYYSILLNEFPQLDKEKREGIQRRLKYNHLSFDAYIEEQMKVSVSNSN